MMADDRTKVGAADRRQVSAEEHHEISYLARKFNTTADRVRRAVRKTGGRRDAVERELDRVSQALQQH
jgi:hypothetical protein